MFILRNIGNFVPPFKDDHDYHGVTAVIEYAVLVLKVKDIIVCGHSHCGACASLYHDISSKNLVHVKKWLELGQKAKEYALNELSNKNRTNNDDLLRITEKISVVHQLQNLATYPQIIKRVKKGKLNIHGWFYNIEDGSIQVYDPKIKEYKKLQ